MTNLLSRLLVLFPERVRREDLFTEAVARLFERNPRLCLDWLKDLGLISSGVEGPDGEHVIVQTQKWLRTTDGGRPAGRADLFIEIRRSPGVEEEWAAPEVVVIESKIGSKEGSDQLKGYAEYLEGTKGFGRKTLIYITSGYDPKVENTILSGPNSTVHYKQLRWHDFYRFLEGAEVDALVEEIKTFMEEQGMARDYRFSTADLAALSGMLRASDILVETLRGEVRARLEMLAGRRLRREAAGLQGIRDDEGYFLYAPLFENGGMECYIGYWLAATDGYPRAWVGAYPKSGSAAENELAVAAMKRMLLRQGWEGANLDDPIGAEGGPEIWREMSLASVLAEEDHINAVQRFFVESLGQLGEELAAFKRERPDLPWAGE